MKTGVVLSGALHGGFIAVVVLGLPWLNTDRANMEEVTTVSIIDAAELDAMTSSAPEAPAFEPDEISAPSFEEDAGDPPEMDFAPIATVKDDVEAPSEQDEEADLTAVATRLSNVEVQAEVETQDEVALDQLSSLTMPSSPGSDLAISRPQAPSLSARPPAPRPSEVISVPNPPSLRDTPPSRETVEETVPEETTEDVAAIEPDEATSPEESTPEVTPDEPNGEPEGLIQQSARPIVRPRNFEAQLAKKEKERLAEIEAAEAAERERIEAEEEEAEAARLAQEQADAEAAEIAAALAEVGSNKSGDDAPAEAASSEELPLGPPIDAGSENAFIAQLSGCWNFDPGMQNAAEMVVTMEFNMNPDGSVVQGSIKALSPPDAPGIKTAITNARAAIVLCEGAGYPLPSESYGRWKTTRVTFDPSKGSLSW